MSIFINLRSDSIRRTIFPPLILLLFFASEAAGDSRQFDSAPEMQSPEISLQSAPQKEQVHINGETYTVPPPWAGNRYAAPEFDYSDFRPVPVAYTHNGSEIHILKKAHSSLVALLQAAEDDGIFLKVESAYRSARYQKQIFERMLAENRTFEDIVRYVAPPGYSQHMLGTSVDFFTSNWRFAETPAYAWLLENGPRFGFQETYSRSNSMKAPWESWHWNFTGPEDGLQAVSDHPPAEIEN